MLVIKGKISTLIAAGINVTKVMASEEKSLRASANNHDENVIFRIHPSMYLASCSGDRSQLKPHYKHLHVTPNDSVKIPDVELTWTNYFSLAFLNKLQERSEVRTVGCEYKNGLDTQWTSTKLRKCTICKNLLSQ